MPRKKKAESHTLVEKKKIASHRLAYHPEEGCEVRFKFEGGTNWNKLKVSSTDLAALAAIFSESPVYLTNGWIHTGEEIPG